MGFRSLVRYLRRHLYGVVSAALALCAIAALAAPARSSRNAPRLIPTSSKSEAISAPTSIRTIRHWSSANVTHVAIDLSGDVQFKSGRFEDRQRLYFDLYNTHLASSALNRKKTGEDGFLRSIRTVPLGDAGVRIILYLTKPMDDTVELVADPYRLEITMRPPGGAHAASQASNTQNSPAVPDSQQQHSGSNLQSAATSKPSVPQPGPDTASSQTDIPGEHSLTRALGLKISKIVIDPGHGGDDVGGIGPSGVYEKDVALDVAMRLGRLLHNLGAEVSYTRIADMYLPLEARTAKANREQADLFISIHANSSTDHNARGLETYYLNFTSEPDALAVAARENIVAQKSVSQLRDLVQKIAMEDKLSESRQLATAVQTSFIKELPQEHSRGVKEAPFIVLTGANMPAILAEISFISNADQENQLKDPKYRQKLAQAIYEGVSDYSVGLTGGPSVMRARAMGLAPSLPGAITAPLAAEPTTPAASAPATSTIPAPTTPVASAPTTPTASAPRTPTASAPAPMSAVATAPAAEAMPKTSWIDSCLEFVADNRMFLSIALLLAGLWSFFLTAPTAAPQPATALATAGGAAAPGASSAPDYNDRPKLRIVHRS